ncbi:MAG: hypothetical protein ACI4TX_01420, partial [Christensenellales bacterium]
LAIVQLAITFFIRVYIMNAISITGNAEIDKIIFSIISISLIALTIKNFVDIVISKKQRMKLSSLHKIIIYCCLVVLSCAIWWLMNYDLFWIFLIAFIISYVIVFCMKFKQLQQTSINKKELKKILKYSYNLQSDKLKASKGDERIFKLGKDKEIQILMLNTLNLSIDIQNDLLTEIEDFEVVENEDGEKITEIKNYFIVVFKNVQISDLVKIVKSFD